jgi:hypothetical protein
MPHVRHPEIYRLYEMVRRIEAARRGELTGNPRHNHHRRTAGVGSGSERTAIALATAAVEPFGDLA